ncbi:MAG: serine protease [Rhodocyclaceae bacterium]|nr:serine protease [Rhodocyclaceae bacterium]
MNLSRTSRAALGALALGAVATAGAAEDASDYSKLLAKVAPAIVNVKVVLKTEYDFGGSMQDQESTIDARGAVVDPRGLVLVWNSQLSAGRLLEAARQMGGEGLQIKITPTDFRISVAGRAAEYRAFLAGADSDLDLAFLQIEGPVDPPLAAIDFDQAAAAKLGETVVGVSRLSPAFDRAAFFETARVAGQLAKPRRAWVLDASPALLGLPVFSLRGEPVGVVATILSRVDESAPQGGDMMDFFALGRGRMESGPLGVFLIPADRVRGVLTQARKRAAELLAERAAATTVPVAPMATPAP